jgi:lysylphosphatidylglycerol synthetase-like protein (DUF2156 family)
MDKRAIEVAKVFIISYIGLIFALSIIIHKFNYTAWVIWFALEGSLVEYSTVILLLFAFLCWVKRFISGYANGSKIFRLSLLVIILSIFFIIGEEISWGQHIFKFKPSPWFLVNNRQAEFNLHNLDLGFLQLDKFIFYLIVIILFLAYLILLPLVANYSKAFRSFLDRVGIPLPKLYLSVFYCFFIALGIVYLSYPNDRGLGEAVELLEAAVILLVTIDPKNREVYTNQ